MACFINHKRNDCRCRKCEKNRNEKYLFVQEDAFANFLVCADEQVKQLKENISAAPILRDGLYIKPSISYDNETNEIYITGAQVFYNGIKVFTVNELGRRLLIMADGVITINEMINKLDLHKNASDVGMFFVTLGQAGYLKNRIEIKLYENKNFVEEYV
ncbi:MAG: hypothetical protein FWD23_02465 [Oscillospiraceae bacterium]|nr:hypothetical protein [Oscillospiraceae bacterium]